MYEEDLKLVFGSQHGTTDILCTDFMYLKSIYIFIYAFFLFVNSLKIIKIDRNMELWQIVRTNIIVTLEFLFGFILWTA